MDEFSAGEQAARKRAVFEAMSPRRRRRIEKRGYENWDPFQPPKDPIEIRRDVSQRTSGQLVQRCVGRFWPVRIGRTDPRLMSKA